jgi:hypothetical protein
MVIDTNLFPHVFHMGGAPRRAIADESSASTTSHKHSSRTRQITIVHHNEGVPMVMDRFSALEEKCPSTTTGTFGH